MSKDRPYAPPRDPDEIEEDTALDAPEGELDFNDSHFREWGEFDEDDDFLDDEDEFSDNGLEY